MDKKQQGTFFAVSTGPGNPDMLTLQAIHTLEQCDIILYPQTSGQQKKQIAGDVLAGRVSLKDKKVFPVSFEMTRSAEVLTQTYAGAASLCTEHLSAGNDVAFLSIGDVSLYSTAGRLASLIRASGYRTIYIPGVSSVSAAACTCALDLAGRDSSVTIIPGDAFYTAGTLEAALCAPGTKVIMKAARHLKEIIDLLRELNLVQKTSLVQNCSMEGELQFSGAELEQLPPSFFSDSYLTVIIVTEQESE